MNTNSVKGFADGIYASPIASTKRTTIIPATQNTGPLTFTPTPRISFKETVEFYASKHDVLFMPTGKINSTGKALFRFGKVHVYIDGSVVYAEDSMGQFTPESLETLLKMQK